MSVYPDLCFIINGSEVEDDSVVAAFTGDAEFLFIPYGVYKIRFSDTRKFAFGTERYYYFTGKFLSVFKVTFNAREGIILR